MNDKEAFILGEIKGIVETIRDVHGNQLDQLSSLARKTNGQVMINKTEIADHNRRIQWLKGVTIQTAVAVIVVIIILGVCILGVEGFVKAGVQ